VAVVRVAIILVSQQSERVMLPKFLVESSTIRVLP
jgi:hypothetical protein